MKEARTLRILHSEASLGWGGQEIRILTEAAGMTARGHVVRVVCPPESRLAQEAARFGVDCSAAPVGRKRLRGLFALERSISDFAPDVINTHSSTDSWLAALACALPRRRRNRRPALVRTRHISAPVPVDPATHWLYSRATTAIVTTGEAIRSQLVRDNGVDPARVMSIPTGIDGARFKPGDKDAARVKLALPREVPLVGIVATLRSWKGHRYLVDAMPLLAHRDARLLIVGDGPQRAPLEAQIEQLGLGSRVLMVGDQHDVAPWLTAMDVFALPSYANEGVPQALLQAMFCGVPSVTTDAGAIGEIAAEGETALIVAREDATSLAHGIDRLLSDRSLALRLSLAALTRVSSAYSLDVMLDRMEVVFRAAIDRVQRAGA